jgi:hypothetical protein
MHSLVSTVVIEASIADDITDMRHVLQKLNNESLAQVFNLRRWCDDLQRLGRTLRPLGDEAIEAKPDQQLWFDFCTTFEQRENEVALLYDAALYELRWLADSSGSLENARKRIAEISEQLITQRARFELLAEKSAAIRRRYR